MSVLLFAFLISGAVAQMEFLSVSFNIFKDMLTNLLILFLRKCLTLLYISLLGTQCSKAGCQPNCCQYAKIGNLLNYNVLLHMIIRWYLKSVYFRNGVSNWLVLPVLMQRHVKLVTIHQHRYVLLLDKRLPFIQVMFLFLSFYSSVQFSFTHGIMLIIVCQLKFEFTS